MHPNSCLRDKVSPGGTGLRAQSRWFCLFTLFLIFVTCSISFLWFFRWCLVQTCIMQRRVLVCILQVYEDFEQSYTYLVWWVFAWIWFWRFMLQLNGRGNRLFGECVVVLFLVKLFYSLLVWCPILLGEHVKYFSFIVLFFLY